MVSFAQQETPGLISCHSNSSDRIRNEKVVRVVRMTVFIDGTTLDGKRGNWTSGSMSGDATYQELADGSARKWIEKPRKGFERA
jgi:hypothetical protein